MLDFFRTANGSLNFVLMGSILVWLSSTGVIVANFYKHRTDTVSAQKAAKLAVEQKGKEESLRIEAEERLAKAEAKIVELTPPPLKARIRAILDRMQPEILKNLALGNDLIVARIATSDLRAIEDIRKESGASDLINVQTMSVVMPVVGSKESSYNDVQITLSPNLLKE